MKDQPMRNKSQNILDTHTVTIRDFRGRIDEQTQKLLVLNSDLFGIEESHIAGEVLANPHTEPTGSLSHLEDELNKMRRALSRLEDNVTTLVSSFREDGNL